MGWLPCHRPPQPAGFSYSCLPQVVKQALAAGKHVIEEKPIALTFEDAVPLIRHYRSMQQAAASDGGGPSPLWMLAENPTRFFYEGLGGRKVGERTDTFSGADVDEVAYAWSNLEAPLMRRKLAPDEPSTGA